MIGKFAHAGYLVFALTMVGLFTIAGCVTDSEITETSGTRSNESVFIPPVTLIPSQTVRPDYIQYISPEESSYIPVDLFNASDKGSGTTHLASENFPVRNPRFGYRSQVCLGLDVSPPLAQPGDDFSESVQDHITLQIDNQLVTEIEMHGSFWATVKTTQDGKTIWLTPQTICGQMVLTLGIHEVDFQFVQTDGTIQEYSWQFALINEAMIVPTPESEEMFTPQVMTIEVGGEPISTPTDLP